MPVELPEGFGKQKDSIKKGKKNQYKRVFNISCNEGLQHFQRRVVIKTQGKLGIVAGL